MPSRLTTSPFLEMGFRPFFLSASVFAIMAMSLWAGVYVFDVDLPMTGMTASQWHAHEMFYGYALAVIAGFLLTSVRTWTQLPTAHGYTLLALLLLWAAARLLWLFGSSYMLAAAIFDMAFALGLSWILARRIVQAKQWKQLAIIGKLLLLTVFQAIFYLGIFGVIAQGVQWGIYGGLYLVIALILTMGRRVIPFFIERAAGFDVQLRQYVWLDTTILITFLLLSINAVFIGHEPATAYLALLLFVASAARLVGWYHAVIFKHCLLWSLYLAFWMISLGFLLLALPYFMADMLPVASGYLAIHAFTVGAIAVITLSMMARVSLGHTGRNVYQPPRLLKYALVAIALSAVVRVVLPYADIWSHVVLVGLSQLLWVLAFALFTWIYAPILWRSKL